MATASAQPPWASAPPPEHDADAVRSDSSDSADGGCGPGAAADLHAAPADRGAASDHEPPKKRRRTAPAADKVPVEAEVEVVDLCDSDDDAPVALPGRHRGGGGGVQSAASYDEVVFVDVSALAPELLARWETESQQRQTRRLQKRAAAAQARAHAGSQPADGGLSGPTAACRDHPRGGGAPQDPPWPYGQGTWDAVADDWRRRNAAGVPPPASSERRKQKSASAHGTDTGHGAGAAGPHSMGSMPWQHHGCEGVRGNVAGHSSHAVQPSEQDACDALRSRLVAQLQRLCAGCASFGSILAALGAPPQGWPWSTDAQLRAAYRAAALKYHPDRSQGEPLADRVWKEEVFKLLARAKAEL